MSRSVSALFNFPILLLRLYPCIHVVKVHERCVVAAAQNFADMKLADLKQVARQMGIRGVSTMRKPQLVATLEAARSGGPAPAGVTVGEIRRGRKPGSTKAVLQARQEAREREERENNAREAKEREELAFGTHLLDDLERSIQRVAQESASNDARRSSSHASDKNNHEEQGGENSERSERGEHQPPHIYRQQNGRFEHRPRLRDDGGTDSRNERERSEHDERNSRTERTDRNERDERQNRTDRNASQLPDLHESLGELHHDKAEGIENLDLGITLPQGRETGRPSIRRQGGRVTRSAGAPRHSLDDILASLPDRSGNAQNNSLNANNEEEDGNRRPRRRDYRNEENDEAPVIRTVRVTDDSSEEEDTQYSRRNSRFARRNARQADRHDTRDSRDNNRRRTRTDRNDNASSQRYERTENNEEQDARDYQDAAEQPQEPAMVEVAGIVDLMDSYAFIRTSGYLPGANDVYVSMGHVRKYGLRKGDAVRGLIRSPQSNDYHNSRQKFVPLQAITQINGLSVEEAQNRPDFNKLTPIYPQQRLKMETSSNKLIGRMMDIVSPIGKGQRGLIVSPPKAGKTITLQSIANAIHENNPECHIMVVLVDERPEEVTDMQRTVHGEVISSTFDKPASDHTTVAELAIERAKRLVELGQDVVVLLDSMTRLARAYNIAMPASGRVLSGGVDAQALYPPKRFFGAARNIENGGSLTIIASALVETGSKMDEVIFEEFKGTGNMELRLSRDLADKRMFPAVDINASGTRREELITPADELAVTYRLRRLFGGMEAEQAYSQLVPRLKKTATNREFYAQLVANMGAQGAQLNQQLGKQ